MKATKYIAAAFMAAAALTATAKVHTETLALGDFDSASEYYDGTSWEAAPANYYFKYSASQVIYTAEELAPIAEKNGKITKVTFKYVEASPAYQSVSLTMDISLDDATADAFIKDAAGKYTWMPFTDTCNGSWEYDLDNYWYFEETLIEISLSTPYEVKKDTPLVITTTASTTDALEYIDCFTSYQYAAPGRPKRAASKCSDRAEMIPVAGEYIEHSSGQYSSGEFADVPVVEFEYTYDDSTDGIADIEAPATEAVYYNLQGIRVAQPTPGAVYLKVEGTKATKVAL